jgi:TPR repeat protein
LLTAGTAKGYYSADGVKKDPKEAYRWYEKAYQLSDELDDPAAWGHAALQMAQAHEEGLGCTQSFKTALAYYEKAAVGLSFELAPERYGLTPQSVRGWRSGRRL